uniref:RING-CH-type domain-containing protein n=1 Tax=Tetradesmus obliquus TaxID=3088 RepID=A0A383VT68_TETOB|eukprot:jgi/Sobl393_1/12735/SZX68697.1
MTMDSLENDIHSHASSDCDSEDFDVCFICLDGPRQQEPLVSPCSCPRKVHAACLAKWQLNCAGKDEETRCRFCHSVLPDWRPALTPQQLKPAASVMSVRYRGVTYRITYTPGPDGLEHFLATLQAIGIKVASASQVTFLCRSPDTGEEMSLKGLKAFDAAAYCASITAAKRVQKDADKRQRKLAAQQQHLQQQQHDVDASPHSDHDLGVRPEAGPDSPRSANWCNDSRRTAHVHAEAVGSGAGRRGASSSAAAAREHASRAHAAFYTAAAGSSGNLAAAGAVAAQQQQQAVAASWWRRALACVHLAPQQQSRQRTAA